MGYKIIDIENETFFKYNASKNYKRTINKKTSKESPFGILKELNLS